MDSTSTDSQTPSTNSEPRRGFLTKFFAAAIGMFAGAVPLFSGLFVFLDPLRKSAGNNGGIRVATLDSVPADGIARYFPVIADRTDAWNRYPDEPIGAVFLRRVKGSEEVLAFNATCPHAGCYVSFNIGADQYQCPCHNSNFQPDGVRIEPKHCPSPRDLDSLEVDAEKLKQGEVWINFKNYLTGKPEKIEKA